MSQSISPNRAWGFVKDNWAMLAGLLAVTAMQAANNQKLDDHIDVAKPYFALAVPMAKDIGMIKGSLDTLTKYMRIP